MVIKGGKNHLFLLYLFFILRKDLHITIFFGIFVSLYLEFDQGISYSAITQESRCIRAFMPGLGFCGSRDLSLTRQINCPYLYIIFSLCHLSLSLSVFLFHSFSAYIYLNLIFPLFHSLSLCVSLSLHLYFFSSSSDYLVELEVGSYFF